jgi:hypothetical protein
VEQHHVDGLLVDVQLVMLPAPTAENTEENGGASILSRQALAMPQAVQRAVATVGQHGEFLRVVAAARSSVAMPLAMLASTVCLMHAARPTPSSPQSSVVAQRLHGCLGTAGLSLMRPPA